MTPEEKAEELVDKFIQYVPAEEEFELDYAKKCALIAIDFTINSFYEFDGFRPNTVDRDYFENIADEIEKL